MEAWGEVEIAPTGAIRGGGGRGWRHGVWSREALKGKRRPAHLACSGRACGLAALACSVREGTSRSWWRCEADLVDVSDTVGLEREVELT